jgi:hypothetical protein
VIPFERRHRNQAQVLNEQGDRDVDPGDRQVKAQLHPSEADGAKNRQGGQFAAVDAKQRRIGFDGATPFPQFGEISKQTPFLYIILITLFYSINYKQAEQMPN